MWIRRSLAISLSSLFYEATACPRRDLRRRISHSYCFHQLRGPFVTQPEGVTPIAGYSCRGIDDNVELVTETRCVFGATVGAARRTAPNNSKRRKDSRACGANGAKQRPSSWTADSGRKPKRNDGLGAGSCGAHAAQKIQSVICPWFKSEPGVIGTYWFAKAA